MSTFMLMAGGTGGHLFPAMALAQELRRRGHVTGLMTDTRATAYGDKFPAREIHRIPAATPSVHDPLKFAGAGFTILGGTAVAWAKLRAEKPDAVVGFGGYPVFPPFLAAWLHGIPGLLHEQNAVMGRANRALARYARRIALSFETTQHADAFPGKTVVTGNPVRDRVRAVAGMPYPALAADGPVKLVVFGGSQGAGVFGRAVPAAIASLPEALRQRLRIVQQVRPDDLDRVAEVYRQAHVNVEVAPFFDDLPERMAAAHLVIGRAGASTVAELGVLGRPSILVPLPGSIDGDQKNNAMVIERAGAGWIMDQATLSPPSLATRLEALIGAPGTLTAAAAAAKSLGRPGAVERLASVAEELVEGTMQ